MRRRQSSPSRQRRSPNRQSNRNKTRQPTARRSPSRASPSRASPTRYNNTNRYYGYGGGAAVGLLAGAAIASSANKSQQTYNTYQYK